MTREYLNRWGEPEDPDVPLPVDEWFPSEKSHDSEDMENLSRASVPIGIMVGVVLAVVSAGVLSYAFESPRRETFQTIAGGALGAWALTFLIPYGTLVYYGAKKRVLLNRRDRGLPVDIVPEDIDEYSVPLHMVPGVAHLWMGPLNSGRKTAPLGMRRARVATYVVSAVFFVSMIVLGFIVQ